MTKSELAWYALQHEISLLPTDERQAASLADAIRDYVTARLAEHDETRAAGGSSAPHFQERSK